MCKEIGRLKGRPLNAVLREGNRSTQVIQFPPGFQEDSIKGPHHRNLCMQFTNSTSAPNKRRRWIEPNDKWGKNLGEAWKVNEVLLYYYYKIGNKVSKHKRTNLKVKWYNTA